MLKCLGGKVKNCNTNETIMSYNEAPDYLYVVLAGTAELATYDYDGNKTILERFTPDSVFGDMFFKPSGNDEFTVYATTSCDVLCFNYDNAINQCENACTRHKLFLDNLFRLLSKKLLSQSQHIEILTKRTIRDKLMSYFEHQSAEKGSFSFSLPMSLSSLADFLSIDRSAMQREIKRLNDDGIIISKGKKIVIVRK
ncbi:MAG: Crp/Fnr family transcriptional regulator [Clostridia bacterium]|nr:Crp/Fnr family transcriptional regulator [Clostridia bacterium]